MERFSDVIEAWPTATAFAADLGVNQVTARAWKRRGIPPEYWRDVVAAARARGFAGITYEVLAGMAARRRRDPANQRLHGRQPSDAA